MKLYRRRKEKKLDHRRSLLATIWINISLSHRVYLTIFRKSMIPMAGKTPRDFFSFKHGNVLSRVRYPHR